MDKKEYNSVNKLLQGEHMAVEVFNTFINKLDNETDKRVFQDIQNQHRNNMSNISSYLQRAGQKPNEKLGIKGAVGEAMVYVQMWNKKNRSQIISKAVKGETNGVNMAEKAVRGNLDDTSRRLVGEVLSKDRMSLNKLQNLR